MNDLHDILRQRLLGLPRVVTRKMFGAEAYFVGPAMFAFFTPTSVVVRLPPSAFTDAVSHGVAKPFLSFGAAQVNGWAEIGFDGREEADLLEAVIDAHPDALGPEHRIGRHAAEQRQGEEAVGDRAAERRLRCRHGIDMDELAVFGVLGEGINPRLIDEYPVGNSDLLADLRGDLFDTGDGHGFGLGRRRHQTQASRGRPDG